MSGQGMTDAAEKDAHPFPWSEDAVCRPSAENDAGHPCCRHCSHRALDGVRGGHERPCDCQHPRVLPPGSGDERAES